MLDILTFDASKGGNVLYKAFAHPLAAERLDILAARLDDPSGLAVYDPDGIADTLFALAPRLPKPTTLLVHDIERLGRRRLGSTTVGLERLPHLDERHLLVAAFDAGRTVARIRHLARDATTILTLDEVRLPAPMLTARRYLDPLNFATNFAFFRDSDGLSTRLVTANYWANYGATDIRLWCRLFAASGAVLAEWEQPVGAGPAGIAIDSREVRARFGLPSFTGQLFIHAIGVAGHDVVKYALDTMGADDERSLSVTHDANAWPSERYAGLPAPDKGERVTLWLQNSHAAPIPAAAISLDRMGADQPVPIARQIGPFETVPVDVGTLLPGLSWPSQIEIRAGRHVVRPRYEVLRHGRTRIAHVNVERADLQPDPNIPHLPASLGRGYLLPFPILPPGRFRTEVQPNPMAHAQTSLPLRLDVFTADGRLVRQRFLGNLSRCFDLAADFDDDAAMLGEHGGHAELVYDFRDGGEADGWLHALVRHHDRASGHVAETSFGAHIFNTIMTYRGEPQSYAGPPPGLSTRLFLKLGEAGRHSFASLIYPASNAWHPHSTTTLHLHGGDGAHLAEHSLAIACSGSALIFPHECFDAALIDRAGPTGYVLVTDQTCRLFGYHGQMDEPSTGRDGFSLDHMFGF